MDICETPPSIIVKKAKVFPLLEIFMVMTNIAGF